jgi:hypothetical protein
VIKSAVGVVLFIYFLGSNAMAPVRPAIIGEPMAVFHREVNRGMWRIVGVPVKAARSVFSGSKEMDIPLRPTIAPGDEASGENQS